MFYLYKKILLSGLLSTSVLLYVGCANNDNNAQDHDKSNTGFYQKNGNTITVRENNDQYNKNNSSRDFGYVRQIKSPSPNDATDMDDIYTPDREKIAHSISKISTTLPKVDDSSVLVTDEEVLIAYTTNGDVDENSRIQTAEQVRKTVMSIVPQSYDVYLTDDPSLRKNIESISAMNVNDDNVEGAIRDTVKQMLAKSPQGKKSE